MNFLGITFSLHNNPLKPFSKNKHALTYMNVASNHPGSIIKQIPNAVNLNIEKQSYSKEIFEVNEALENSGFQLEIVESSQITESAISKMC